MSDTTTQESPASLVQVLEHNAEPLCPPTLADIEKMLSAHPEGLTKAFAEWLVRICRASDARIVELEQQLKGKELDYTGVCLEYQDLSDENNRLKQELEISKIVADARGKTLLELQARVEKEVESARA